MMNDILQIVEAIKQECRKIHKLPEDKQISKEDIAKTMDISIKTLESAINTGKIPHKSIINFCFKYDINIDDIYFKDIQKTCSICPNILEGDKVVWYSTKQKDANGDVIKKQRRICKPCYNKQRADALRQAYKAKK